MFPIKKASDKMSVKLETVGAEGQLGQIAHREGHTRQLSPVGSLP